MIFFYLLKIYFNRYFFYFNFPKSYFCKGLPLLISILILLDFSVFGQIPDELPTGKRILEAYQLQPHQQIFLDGRLEENFWEEIPAATGFLQQEPVEGNPATEKTEVRIAYDKNYLYIGVILYDRDPRGIKAFQRRRNSSLDTDDRFMFFLDTFEDGRNAYFFEINPAGLMGDGLLRAGQGSNVNKAWNGIWQPWVVKGDFGWSAEIRIPFRTLDFDPDNDTWGINFQRTVRRKNEETLWTGHLRNQGIFRPQDGGRLIGLKGLSQGLGLELNPYAITTHDRQGPAENQDSQTRLDAGFDVTYSITSNLRAAITINTDFAETDVDQRQVNLTRFPLFFPEQRNFFLESANIFEFAAASGVDPFFSRRIGLVSGSPIPISYGGRVAGRVGSYNVGFLQVRTARVDTIPAEDFTAGRVVKNIFSESTVGLIYTRRSTVDTRDQFPGLRDRHTIGADIELNTSRFMGNKNLQFQGFFIMNSPEYNTDTLSFMERTARGIRLSFPNQPWSGHVSYRELDVGYDPAVGFTPRNAFRRVQPTITYSPLLEKSNLIREITASIHQEYLMDMNFIPATTNTRLTLLGLRFESGDYFEVQVNRNYERLDWDFDIRRDQSIIIPIGHYVNWSWSVNASSAPFRRVVLNASYSREGFWSGQQTIYGTGITLRPLRGVNLIANWDHNVVNLLEGSFTTHLFRFTGNFDLNPWISIVNFLQYDNLTNLVGLNSRFRWIIRPGTDVFLVYNHNWLNLPDRFASLESQATFKVTYTHRF
jgi:hypothetical protein